MFLISHNCRLITCHFHGILFSYIYNIMFEKALDSKPLRHHPKADSFLKMFNTNCENSLKGLVENFPFFPLFLSEIFHSLMLYE